MFVLLVVSCPQCKLIKILTASTKYQGIDGYLCDNVVCPDFFIVIMTVTYELPIYPVLRMGIVVSYASLTTLRICVLI